MTRVLLALAAIAVAVGCVLGASALWDTIVPEDLTIPPVGDEAFDADVVADAESFESLMRVSTIVAIVVQLAVLVVYARKGAALTKESAAGPIGTGFLLGMMGIALVWLAQVPFGLFEIWWARRHDAVDANYLDWFFGEWGALFGEAIFLCVALLIVMALARFVKIAWWAPASAAFVGLAVGFAFLGPYLYPGLETPSAEIRADADRLTDKGLPDVPVRVEEVHEWTSDPNAFAFGLGESRRVVLWDTLADGFPREEVRVVTAHELGHHHHDHIAKAIGWLALFVVPAALIVAVVTRRRGGLGEPEAVPLALLVIVVLNLLAMPIQNSSSRRYESEADWTALQATNDPKAMEALFKRFTEEGLSDPDPPGWFHTIFDTHPSGADRVAMARAYASRRGE